MEVLLKLDFFPFFALIFVAWTLSSSFCGLDLGYMLPFLFVDDAKCGITDF